IRAGVDRGVRSQDDLVGARGGGPAPALADRRAAGARKPIHPGELDMTTMPGRHVSPVQGGTIPVAVVALVAVAAGVVEAHEPAKSKAAAAHSVSDGAAPTCHAWVVATRRANEKAGNASRDLTLKALAHACNATPEQVRRAAGQVQGMK